MTKLTTKLIGKL